MTKRIALVLFVAVAAFALGVLASYELLWKPKLWLAAAGDQFMADQYTITQYREASYPTAKQALESYISYLDTAEPRKTSWKPGENPVLSAREIRFEKTFAWSRLAVLHERNNNPVAAQIAWNHAEALARQGTWRDPSRNHLRTLIQRQDELAAKPPAKSHS